MRIRARRNLACLLAGVALIAPLSALAAPVTYLAADNINQTSVSAANPLPVTGAQTGLNVAVTPIIQNASYVSGNNMGGLQAVSVGASASVLSAISLASQGGLATAKQIYVFSSNPTASTFTDKGTFTIATADLSKVMWTGAITPSAPTGTTKTWGASPNLALGIPSGGTVYVAVVETTTETPASTTDLVLTLSAF